MAKPPVARTTLKHAPDEPSRIVVGIYADDADNALDGESLSIGVGVRQEHVYANARQDIYLTFAQLNDLTRYARKIRRALIRERQDELALNDDHPGFMPAKTEGQTPEQKSPKEKIPEKMTAVI